MTRTLALLGFLGLGAAAACADNPVLAPDPHEEDVAVTVAFSEEHLATLTDMEVEVTITESSGAPATDFEMVALETRRVGEEAWSTRELELHDGRFGAQHMFYSSGEYAVRVVGQRHGADHADILFERGQHLAVERIHREVGEYRIEMETFPGHLHEGDTAEVRFWAMSNEPGSGHGPGMSPMGGLAPTIGMTHAGSGAGASHMGEEHEPGVYEAIHTFAEHGEVEITMGFDDDHGEHHEVVFNVPVDDNH